MEYEIELKLLTDKNAGEVIDTKLLPTLGGDVKRASLILTNHYFDTPERTLRKNDIGLRIRGNNQHFEQTLKTAGKSIGGLHQRPEYNVTLDPQAVSQQQQARLFPKLALFAKTAWPDSINPMELEPKLEVLFTTHFKRESYLIALSAQDSVELVWDLGEIRSGNKKLDICEIELELKKGSASALFELAKRLVQLLPTSIGIDSKAARGYSLLEDYTPKDPAAKVPEMNIYAQGELNGYVNLLEFYLRHFQQLISNLNLSSTPQNAVDAKNGLWSLCKHVESFAEKFTVPVLQQHKRQLATLFEDWPDKVFELKIFLTRAATTQVQLDILQSLLEQPWLSESKN